MKSSDIEIFNKLAETLSFTRAAQVLGLNRSSVSKCITRLERDLGVNLFNRSSRKVCLTDAGSRYYHHTCEVTHVMKLAARAAKRAQEKPRGVLSVSIPTCLGSLLMQQLVQTFRNEWPSLRLNMNIDDQCHDIIGDGFDVAVRVARKLEDSTLIARELARTPAVLLASPGYLKKFGTPSHVNDLSHHRCLTVSRYENVWRFTHNEDPVEVRLEDSDAVNNRLAMILASCLDFGIIQAPRLLVESEIQRRRLNVILDGFESTREYGIFAIYPRRSPPASVRAFVGFVEEWLPRLGDIDRWDPLNRPNRRAHH